MATSFAVRLKDCTKNHIIFILQDTYKMTNMPRGRAVILNIMNFDGKSGKERTGSNIDAWRLTLLFQQLGFDVVKWNDLTLSVSTLFAGWPTF